MRTVRLFLALIPALILTGCLQSTALVKVNADGSGTVDHRTVMTAEAMAQMKQLAGLFGSGGTKDPFSEADARDMATKMGEGVTLVSSTPLQTPAGEGRANVYSFRDISKLKFNSSPSSSTASVRAGGLGIGGSDIGTVTFGLEKNANGNAMLTMHSPDDMFETFVGRGLGGRGGPQGGVAEQLMMVRQMLAGFRRRAARRAADGWSAPTARTSTARPVTLFDHRRGLVAEGRGRRSAACSVNAKTPAETARR